MREYKQPLKIVITGNIGSGKSLFCRYMEDFGQKVISADEVATKIFWEEEAKWRKRWGEAIMKDGKIERSLLAEIVFEDKEELAFLNGIIHPKVIKRFDAICRNSDKPYLIYEVPLLFEARLEALFDFIILVTAKRDLVLDRLKIRNPHNFENIQKRIKSQIADEEKINKSDLVVENNGSTEDLKEKAKDIVELLPMILRRTSPCFL